MNKIYLIYEKIKKDFIMPVRYNKGEWSEFYVFLKSLSDKKLSVLNIDQSLTDDFYRLLKVDRTEGGNLVEYVLTDSSKILKINGQRQIEISTKFISDFLPDLLNQIVEATGASFGVKGIEEVLCALDTGVVKEGTSADKADITMAIDYKDQLNKTIGFNIKSNIGHKPTLLNASKATNFIYEIQNFDGDISLINSYDGRSKIRDRITAIKQCGADIVFVGLENSTFFRNLIKIDTQLPEILSYLLLNYFSGFGRNLQEIVNSISPLHLANCTLSQEDLSYKLKKFLVANALGFFPAREWDGHNKAHGYIIVKVNGDIGCFDVFAPEVLENYLYFNVKFDTPSSSRHDFGTVYEKNGKKYIKLNLQIRFI